MALILKDRVKETTTVVGTGSATLLGAVVGFQSFSVIGNGNTTYYTITNGTDWEVGIGTYTASGTVLSRDTVYESSNGGAKVVWTAGVKDVFVTYPAERAVYTTEAGAVGATTVGTNLISLTNPSAITFPRFNADNTVSALDAATFRTAIGAGTGTVTSVGILGGSTGLTFSNSPITSSGDIIVGGKLAVANGGTGTNSWTIGSLITFNATTNATEVTPGTSGYPLISNGTGTLPTYSQINITDATTGTLTATRGGTSFSTYTTGDLIYASATNTLSKLPIGASGYVLTSNGTNMSWQAAGGGGGGVTSFSAGSTGLTPNTATTGAVTLAGTLALASGGTGQTTKAAAFNALSPITTTGDLIIGNGTNSNTRLAIGAFGRYLYSNGTTASWQTLSVSASDISGTLQYYQGGTGTTSYPSNGQLLIGNGGGYSVAALTAGSGVTITNASGSITISASGGGGGPYIQYIQFEDSGIYYGNGPLSPQQSPTVYWDSGINVAAFWFYSTSGGGSASGTNITSLTVQDSTGAYSTFYSGVDFSSSVNWYANGNTVGMYGLLISNTTLRTLMSNTAGQLGSPALAPRSVSIFGSQSSVYASVSGGVYPSYQSGGYPIVVRSGPAPGQYYLYFTTNDLTGSYGMYLNYLQFEDSTGAINTYYNGMDFSNYGATNSSSGEFNCEISSITNSALTTLLDNTIIV